MKTSIFFAAFSIVALSIFLICARCDFFDHNITVSVNEDEGFYSFSAVYNKENTRRVEGYINKNIIPNRLGSSENDHIDATTSLTDNTRFYILESPGKLKIKLDKKENSTASYLRIKRMCEGLKRYITD